MKKIRACAMVVDKDRVLLLWRKIGSDAYFVFPGGGKEDGETLEEAVKREASEETSIEVRIEKLIGKLSTATVENHFYLCSYVSGEPALGDANEAEAMSEMNQYEPMWKDISDLPSLDVRPDEAKTWFLEAHKNKFIGYPRELTVSISANRGKY